MTASLLKTSRTLRPQKVALVGGGKGGCSLLNMLLIMPGVVMYKVYDLDLDAPAMALAREHNIDCAADPTFEDLAGNPEIDIILEVTGNPEVFRTLHQLKHEHTSLIGSNGSRFMFDVVDIFDEARRDLEAQQNVLEAEIAERTEDLRLANEKLQKQIEDYRQLNENLQRVNDEKTSYLLRSTHQLKAPFAAIQSFVDVILDGFTGQIPDKTAEVMVKIKDRCELLSHSIKQMLKLANLKSIVMSNVRMAHYSLDDIISMVVDESKPVADGLDISVEVQSDPGGIEVMCSRAQLQILLSVLVQNAVSYSHKGGNIEIKVRKTGESVTASVTDHGIGMSQETQERIFEEFYRSNRAVEHDTSGTGLGLTIAQRIAALHGFTLEVVSAVGEGSTFSLVIPQHFCRMP